MLLNVVPGTLFAFAQQYVTSVLAGIINATTPLMTLLFLLILFREEKLKREQIFGLLIGAFGVLTVLGIWKGIGDNQLIGVIAMLLAVACYGYSFPYITRNISPLGLKPEAAAAAQLSMASITLLPFYLLNGIADYNFRIQALLAMLALGIITPVVAVFVGWLFLGEAITWYEPVGAILVILGAAVAQGRFSRKVQSK